MAATSPFKLLQMLLAGALQMVGGSVELDMAEVRGSIQTLQEVLSKTAVMHARGDHAHCQLVAKCRLVCTCCWRSL